MMWRLPTQPIRERWVDESCTGSVCTRRSRRRYRLRDESYFNYRWIDCYPCFHMFLSTVFRLHDFFVYSTWRVPSPNTELFQISATVGAFLGLDNNLLLQRLHWRHMKSQVVQSWPWVHTSARSHAIAHRFGEAIDEGSIEDIFVTGLSTSKGLRQASTYCVGDIVDGWVERVNAASISAMPSSVAHIWSRLFTPSGYVSNITSLALGVFDDEVGFRHKRALRAAADESFTKK